MPKKKGRGKKKGRAVRKEPEEEAFQSGERSDVTPADDEEEENETPAVPFVKSIEMRERRGTRMGYLIARDDVEDDDFWRENKYFGKFEDLDKDDEIEYEQESEEADVFDSDFDNENDQEGEEEEAPQAKDDEEKEARTSAALRQRKLNSLLQKRKQKSTRRPKKNARVKTQVVSRKVPVRTEPEQIFMEAKAVEDKEEIFYEKEDEEEQNEGANIEVRLLVEPKERKPRYIHNFFSQEDLLRDAALNELLNQQSLQKLIRMEEEKKKYRTSAKSRPQPPIVRHRFFLENSVEKSEVYVPEERLVKSLFTLSEQPKQVNPAKPKYKHPTTKEEFNDVIEYKRAALRALKSRKKQVKHTLKVLRDVYDKKHEIVKKSRKPRKGEK